jgi:ribonuclease P protein component
MKTKQFTKLERMKSKTAIEALFLPDCQKLNCAPFRIVWKLQSEFVGVPVQVLIICPKKRYKRAHTRNRIKRQIREIYRVQKSILWNVIEPLKQTYSLGIFYSGPEEMDFNQMKTVFCAGLSKIAISIEKAH